MRCWEPHGEDLEELHCTKKLNFVKPFGGVWDLNSTWGRCFAYTWLRKGMWNRAVALFFTKPFFWSEDGPIRVRNPLLVLLEKTGLVPPRLVAMVDEAVSWPADEDEDTEADYEEEITYYLLQWPSGRRGFDYHSYGKAQDCDYHEVNLRDIIAWTHGGPLPPGSRPLKKGHAEIIPLRVVKDTPPAPPPPSSDD